MGPGDDLPHVLDRAAAGVQLRSADLQEGGTQDLAVLLRDACPDLDAEHTARVLLSGFNPRSHLQLRSDGWPLEQFRKEHEAAAGDHKVWGVPTFVKDDQSVFVRLMTRPQGDGALAAKTIERVVDLVGGFPELNEFKHTSIPR